ncbi:MAG: hypothetical protein ACI9XJ_002512 [Marivirga sp.]|jgi:hypothetical protein
MKTVKAFIFMALLASITACDSKESSSNGLIPLLVSSPETIYSSDVSSILKGIFLASIDLTIKKDSQYKNLTLGSHIVTREAYFNETAGIITISYFMDVWSHMDWEVAQEVYANLVSLHGAAKETPVNAYDGEWRDDKRLAQKFEIATSSLLIVLSLYESRNDYDDDFKYELIANYRLAK